MTKTSTALVTRLVCAIITSKQLNVSVALFVRQETPDLCLKNQLPTLHYKPR